MTAYLEWIGCTFGAIGALLLALNTAYSAWGFVAFLVSNVCWIAFGLLTGAPGLVIMQLVMTATSFLGLYRWMAKKPLKPEFDTPKGAPSC
jgi:uncharacterized membrane protein YhhN